MSDISHLPVLFITKLIQCNVAYMILLVHLYCTSELLLDMCLWSSVGPAELKIVQEVEENIYFVTSRKYNEEDS